MSNGNRRMGAVSGWIKRKDDKARPTPAAENDFSPGFTPAPEVGRNPPLMTKDRKD